MKRAIVCVLLVTAIFAAPLNPKKVGLAINCGSPEAFTGSDGVKYVADVNLAEGDSREANYNTNSALEDVDIKFTFDREIYMFEKHTYSKMTYKLPVKEGFNTLILKFAEMYFNEKGKRVFDVSIGSTVVLKNFDVVAEVGKFAAADKYIEVEIKQGKCLYNGGVVADALDKGRLKVSFSKGKADNPIVQGIILYNAPLSESNFNEYTTLKTKWAQQKEMAKAKKQEQELKDLIAVQKKKEKIVIRNDQLEIVDDEETGDSAAPGGSRGRIRYLLTSPLGVLIWAVLISCGLVFLYNNVFLMKSEGAKLA